MPRRPALRRPALRRLGLPTACAALMVVLVVGGALWWYLPGLTAHKQRYAEVPAPPALFALTQYPIPAHGRACMDEVAVTPDSRLADFTVYPGAHSRHGGPPLAFTLQGGGYRATTRVPGGYPGGAALVPIQPPRRSVIATACFRDLGARPATLIGTIEPRSVSRSHLWIDGRPQVGDVTFSFLETPPHTLVHQMGQVAQRASILTDRLLPAALIWVIAILAAFGVPILVVMAWRAALAGGEETAPAAE